MTLLLGKGQKTNPTVGTCLRERKWADPRPGLRGQPWGSQRTVKYHPTPANTRTTSSVFIFRQGLLDLLLPLESSAQCHAEDRTHLHTVSAVKEFWQKEEQSQNCTNNLFLLTFT